MFIDSIKFDIETDTNDVAESFMPEFEPDARLTDPVKIEQSVLKKQEAWKEKCALDPVTGCVLCIGYQEKAEKDPYVEAVDDGLLPPDKKIRPCLDEAHLLQSFWEKYHNRQEEYLVGWNIHEFDMWFIYQRSLINGVRPGINPLDRNWRMTIDLMEIWNRFNRRKMSALDEVAKALGVGHKIDNGEVSKNFGFFWKENRKLALENVIGDVMLTRAITTKLL
jgi:DNA polymerase elongation subunit (family B)